MDGNKNEEEPPRLPIKGEGITKGGVLKHERLVSWGDHHQFPGELPAIVQPAAAAKPNGKPNTFPTPKTSEAYSDNSSIRLGNDGESPFPSSPLRSYSSAENGANTVNLSDILEVNPLESEAETLILRAIEKQDANTGNTSLLSNIPDASVNVFSPPPEGNDHQGGDFEHETNSTQNRARLGTVDSQSNARAQQKKKPKPQHKRNKTMEETLASLTQAMAGFQGSDDEDSVDSRDQHHRGVDAAVASAGEAFAHNANLVFRGKQKSERRIGPGNDEGARNPKTAKHWGAVKASIKAPPSGEKVGLDHATAETQNENTSPKKWGLLRNAVTATNLGNHLQASGSADVHKKTDSENEPIDPIQEDLEGGIPNQDAENSQGSGTGGGGDRDDEIPIKKKKGRRSPHRKTMVQTGAMKDFQVFVDQRRSSFFTYARFLLLLVFSAMGVASILYYPAGNPPTGVVDFDNSGKNGVLVNFNGDFIDPERASASWWIIFVCVRQVLTFSLAQLLQVFIIDFLCLSSRCFVSIFGNGVTLLIAQSKGWPFVIITWSVLDFVLLHGTSKFATHWLYWQDVAGIFNESNPGGSVTSDNWNTTALTVALCVGIAVSLKRLWLGLYLGKKTFANYAEDLSKVVKKALMLCEVAALARECQPKKSFGVYNKVQRAPPVTQFGISRAEFDGIVRSSAQHDDDDYASRSRGGETLPNDTSYDGGFIIDPVGDPRRSTLDQSQKMKINDLLGAWEDPEDEVGAEDNTTISGILQFRQSLSFLDNRFMFSIAWGDVSTRDRMIISSQEVYSRLLLRSTAPNKLSFDVLARLAEGPDGTLDQDKLKDVIRLFRPDRDGNLSLLEFVKSVDSVYKEAKFLRASVKNSEKIDRAFENAFNVLFYTVTVCVVLSQIGYDPVALFLSLSGLVLAFAFMIGSASAKMFEGMLFILIRSPYNIGDRIHVSNVNQDTSPNGSSSWIVKDVTLFHTTAVFATTGERATMSNGSLASSRVINMARSPNGVIYIYLKFSTNVPYERIQIFEQAVREFVKARPREWASFSGFRATQVLADLGYIEYVTILKHREAWQNVGAILESKAQVASFCLELSKKLDMRYTSPPLPVDLAIVTRGNEVDNQSAAAKLAGLAAGDFSGMNELSALFDKTK